MRKSFEKLFPLLGLTVILLGPPVMTASATAPVEERPNEWAQGRRYYCGPEGFCYLYTAAYWCLYSWQCPGYDGELPAFVYDYGFDVWDCSPMSWDPWYWMEDAFVWSSCTYMGT